MKYLCLIRSRDESTFVFQVIQRQGSIVDYQG